MGAPSDTQRMGGGPPTAPVPLEGPGKTSRVSKQVLSTTPFAGQHWPCRAGRGLSLNILQSLGSWVHCFGDSTGPPSPQQPGGGGHFPTGRAQSLHHVPKAPLTLRSLSQPCPLP